MITISVQNAYYIFSVIAVLFAMSTLISWAYYGQKAWTFLLGEGKKRV